MFPNATAYEIFMKAQCFRCTKYVDWVIGTPCPIEEALAISSVVGESTWPPEVNSDEGRCAEFEEMPDGQTHNSEMIIDENVQFFDENDFVTCQECRKLVFKANVVEIRADWWEKPEDENVEFYSYCSKCAAEILGGDE